MDMDDPGKRGAVISATAKATARIIAPRNRTIRAPLIRAGEMVWAMGQSEAGPLRADVKAALLRIARAAVELDEALDTEAGAWAFRDEGLAHVADQLRFRSKLTSLGVRAHAHAETLAGAGAGHVNGRELRGQGKDAIPPHIACAAAVREVWHAAHGGYPTNNNRAATDACEALWEGLGLRRGAVGWGDERKGWQRHLSQARRLHRTIQTAVRQRLFLTAWVDS